MSVCAGQGSGIIVGAYASSPTAHRWDPAVESSYLAGLAEVAGIRGLELPWLGSLHPHDEPWLLATLPPRWQVVLTSVGYTVAAVARDPTHGLASDDAEGRRAAVANVAEMLAGVRRLNDSAGNAVVTAVELQAGPGPHAVSSASAAALFPEAAAANRGVFYAGGAPRSLGEVREFFADKLGETGGGYVPSGGNSWPPAFAAPAPAPAAPRRPSMAAVLQTSLGPISAAEGTHVARAYSQLARFGL